MFLKVSRVFLVVGLWGRAVRGVAPGSSASGGAGRARKTHETLALAVSERIKMRGAFCESKDCPPWPKEGDHYRVPYALRGDAYTEQQAADFKWVVDFINRLSNLKFEKRGAGEEGNYLDIYNANNGLCYCDQLDWEKEPVLATLSGDCMTTGTISEVLLQAAGFYYEHTRPDRDEHITVQNICPAAEYAFEKRETVAFKTPYDYASVMHLPSRGEWYTCPKEDTSLVSLVAADTVYGPAMDADKMGPSTCDLAALCMLYPGPVKAPDCVVHDPPAICAPVPGCDQILGNDATCHYECKMKCQHNLAPTSKQPACRLRTVKEIAAGSLTTLPPTSSARRAAHFPAAMLLGCAVGVAFASFIN